MFLFVKAKYFCYSLFDLSVETFFLYLNRLPVRHKKHFVSLTIVVGLVLAGALGVTGIFRIRDNHVVARLAVKTNRFLITGTRDYLVSMPFNIIS
jgi:hypothetical protein